MPPLRVIEMRGGGSTVPQISFSKNYRYFFVFYFIFSQESIKKV